MSSQQPDCPFCNVESSIIENELSFAIFDSSPVGPGHALILPKRHFPSIFDARSDEVGAMISLVAQMRRRIDAELRPDGYNIGVNAGETAGQTVMHVHIHLIPRFRGDMNNPRGGVRGVIPAKQSY